VHDDIKRFALTGTITSDTFLAARESLIKELEDGMRDDGFVPVLDLLPHFTREYDPDSETFSFELSVYGTYVGDESWRLLGMMSGIPQERYTPQQK
jgi:hypothetical protein